MSLPSSLRLEVWDRREGRQVREQLPASADTEKFVLGSILLDSDAFGCVLASLSMDDFSLEKHRRIFRRMRDISGRGDRVDRVTVLNELRENGEIDAVDGIGYIVSLDDGLPLLPKIDSYLNILHEKAALRRILHACQHFANRATSGDTSTEITSAARELFESVSATGQRPIRISEIPTVWDCGASAIEYIREPELPKGAVVALTGDSGSGKSTLATAWARDAKVPTLFLDRENPIAVISDRLDRLGFEDGPLVKFWGGWLSEEAPVPDSAQVMDWVRSCDSKPILVVDSLVAFHGGDENDAGETRNFMHRCRRAANLGATVVVIHHNGKAETAKDYRGSSDFKAAVDLGFHVTNFGDGCLDKLILRPFKTRIQVNGELAYDYAGGRFIRSGRMEAQQTVNEQLIALLRLNPGVTSRKFEELAMERGIGRQRAREFLGAGVLAGSVRRETGARNTKKHYLKQVENGD
jgi:hypothetical protein